MLLTILTLIAVFGPPCLSLGWFVRSFQKYRRTDPEDTENRSRRKTKLIISIIVTIVLWAALAALITLFFMSLAHM